MGVPSRHILSQGPVLAALGRTLAGAVQQRVRASTNRIAPALRGGVTNGSSAVAHTPGPELQAQQAPLPRALIDDYVRHVGGDPRAYRGEVPPHLFPQWCLPLLARTLEGLPYPLLRVVNGGCNVRMNAPIPDDEPLQIRARLFEIDDDGRRSRLHQQVRTGTASAPDALEVDVFAVVPLSNTGKSDARSTGNGASKPGNGARPHAPEDAREVARFALGKDAGLSFAKLTGDFNPIHWVPWVARASGFRRPILHGFAELAYAWEGLNKNVLGGDVHAVTAIDVRLTRPLVLPHEVGLFVRGRELSLADAPGGPSYLTGTFRLRGEP